MMFTWLNYTWRDVARQLISVPLIVAALFAGLYLTPTSVQITPPVNAATAKSQDLSFYAFGPLTTAIVSGYGHVGNGKYCREVLNTTRHQNKVELVRVKSGKGTTVTLAKKEQRRICVKLGSSPNTQYGLLLLDPEITWSAGVWTPQNTHIHYANPKRHWDIVCSTNPLKRPAVFNVLKASTSGSWHLADYTAHYVQPGHTKCLQAHQKPDVYMRLRSEWRRGHARSRQTYEVVAYKS